MGMCVLYGSYMGVAPSPLLICYVFFSIGSSFFFDSYQIFIIKKIPPLLIYPYIDTPLLSHPHIPQEYQLADIPIPSSNYLKNMGGERGGYWGWRGVTYYLLFITVWFPLSFYLTIIPKANKIANNKITQQLSTTIILSTTIKANNKINYHSSKANNNKINNSTKANNKIAQGQ